MRSSLSVEYSSGWLKNRVRRRDVRRIQFERGQRDAAQQSQAEAPRDVKPARRDARFPGGESLDELLPLQDGPSRWHGA